MTSDDGEGPDLPALDRALHAVLLAAYRARLNGATRTDLERAVAEAVTHADRENRRRNRP